MAVVTAAAPCQCRYRNSISRMPTKSRFADSQRVKSYMSHERRQPPASGLWFNVPGPCCRRAARFGAALVRRRRPGTRRWQAPLPPARPPALAAVRVGQGSPRRAAGPPLLLMNPRDEYGTNARRHEAAWPHARGNVAGSAKGTPGKGGGGGMPGKPGTACCRIARRLALKSRGGAPPFAAAAAAAAMFVYAYRTVDDSIPYGHPRTVSYRASQLVCIDGVVYCYAMRAIEFRCPKCARLN